MRVLDVGTALLCGVLVACGGPGTHSGTPAATSTRATASGPTTATPATGTATVRLVLEPVCGPSSPQPTGCDSRPLPGVGVTVSDASGRAVAGGTSDAQGECTFALAPGRYVARGADVPAAVPPAPANVTVTGGGPVTVTIRYASNLQ